MTPKASRQTQDPILAPLNEAQRRAVTHREGPLLVIAGPGSGKTRVITHRIAYLVRQGVDPVEILAITFTNKAAGEMRERVEGLLGLTSPWISTFHSFAARLLRRHIYRLSPFDTSFSIYDADDSLALVKTCIKELDIATDLLSPRQVLSEISQLKNRGVEDPELIPQNADFHDGSTPAYPFGPTIERHGGEAAEVRDAWRALSDREKSDLYRFVSSR